MPDHSTIEDVVKVYLDNEGKLHIDIDTDVVIKVNGTEYKSVSETSVATSGLDTIVLTGRHHHINPAGTDFYDQRMDGIASPHLREVMEDREQVYKELHNQQKRRSFYLRSAIDNMHRRKPSKGGKARCGCKK